MQRDSEQFERFEQYLSEEDIKSIREQIKAYNFKAGKEDYEIFLESPIWADFEANILERIDSLSEKLENLSNSHIADVVYKSRIHELRQLLEYPIHVTNLLSVLEDKDVIK